MQSQEDFSLITSLFDHEPLLLRSILFSFDDPKDLGNALFSYSGFYKSLYPDDPEKLRSGLLFFDVREFEKTSNKSGYTQRCFVDKTGRKHGLCQLVSGDYVLVEENYFKGQRHGKSIDRIKGVHREYKNGVADGEFRIYDPSGLLKMDGTMKNGKVEGKVREWVGGYPQNTRYYKNGEENMLMTLLAGEIPSFLTMLEIKILGFLFN